MKVGMIQQSCTPDIESNIVKLENNIRRAAAMGAQLVVLQELHNSVYFCQSEDASLCDLAEPIPGPSTSRYGALASELGIVLVLSLFERRTPGIYHNTAVVIEKDGSIAGTYRKMHIPDDPCFYEKFYFTPGDLGFRPIETSVGSLGVLVCWDQWYPEAARLMAMNGAELLIYPTAIGGVGTDSKEEQETQRMAWQLVQRGHSVANGLPVVTVNRVGHEDDPTGNTIGLDFWGFSFATGPQGEILEQFPTDSEDVRVVELDLDRTEYVRRGWPFFRDRRIDAYGDILKRFGK
ncbi:MAG: carbon-nitrogen hydrolase [Candidatus Cryptobacteroides sp.]